MQFVELEQRRMVRCQPAIEALGLIGSTNDRQLHGPLASVMFSRFIAVRGPGRGNARSHIRAVGLAHRLDRANDHGSTWPGAPGRGGATGGCAGGPPCGRRQRARVSRGPLLSGLRSRPSRWPRSPLVRRSIDQALEVAVSRTPVGGEDRDVGPGVPLISRSMKLPVPDQEDLGVGGVDQPGQSGPRRGRRRWPAGPSARLAGARGRRSGVSGTSGCGGSGSP